MKQRIGAFIAAAVRKGEAARTLKQQLVIEIYLAALEKKLTREATKHSPEGDARELRTLLNVFLRYPNPKQWRNYVQGLAQRKKWWDDKEKTLTGAPDWASQLWDWLREGPEKNKASEILNSTREDLRRSFYGKKSAKRPLPTAEEFDACINTAISQMHEATLREFVCRWIGGALWMLQASTTA